MNNQNQMFSPQENIPHEQQQAWQEVHPIREPRYSSPNDGEYSAGYSGTEPGPYWMNDQKMHPPKVAPVIPIWQWVVGGILLLVLASVLWSLISFILGSVFLIAGIAVVLLAISQLSIRIIAVPPRTFLVQERARLVIHNPAGSIRIHRGETSKVEIRAIKHVNGWLGSVNEGTVDMLQEGKVITVRTRSGSPWSLLGGLRNVTLDITAPEMSDIRIEGNAGEIQIDGITGQVQASTDAGSISLQEVALSGQSSLKTSAGTISLQEATVSGQSNLKTSAGTITVHETTLKGNVRFDTNLGTISFDGTLDPQGSYRFDTNLGTIDITLPSNSSFVLAATTDLGTVTNAFGDTTVGPAPHAKLELHTNLGTVSVHRG